MLNYILRSKGTKSEDTACIQVIKILNLQNFGNGFGDLVETFS